MNLPSGIVGAVLRILVVYFQSALWACGHATRSFTKFVGRSSSIFCKISLPKKVVTSINKNWWPITEMFYVLVEFKFLSPPLLYRKCDFVFRCAPRAYWNLNIEFISHVYIDHSLLTNTSPSKHDDHLLHQIYDFYCYSTKESIFTQFLRYLWCEK